MTQIHLLVFEGDVDETRGQYKIKLERAGHRVQDVSTRVDSGNEGHRVTFHKFDEGTSLATV